MTEPDLEHHVIDGLRSIADGYEVVLCDVWGVVHDGVRLYPRAVEALARFRARGGTVVLITNAPRPAGAIIGQLDGLGAPRDAFDAVVTSGDVTLSLMAERGAAALHHIGPARDLPLFEEYEATTKLRPARVPLAAAEYVVCTGLNNDETEGPEDYDPVFDDMEKRSLTMICANPDLVVHRGDQLLYCAGALAARYQERGGDAVYAGKPHPPIYVKALAAANRGRSQPVSPTRVLAIGDAVRTDVAGAAGFGINALFVTNGIHRDELHHLDGRLDHARYLQFAGEAPFRPKAAIPDLVW